MATAGGGGSLQISTDLRSTVESGTRPTYLRHMARTEVVRVASLLPGDLITETDTPEGPWYRVARVDLRDGVLFVEEDIPVFIDAPDAGVLRRVAS